LLRTKTRKKDEQQITAGATVDLPAKKTITVWWKYRLPKHANDSDYSSFSFPTAKPSVRIKAPESLVVKVQFMHREENEMRPLGSGYYEHPGTLLPSQSIRIRWWKKDDAQE